MSRSILRSLSLLALRVVVVIEATCARLLRWVARRHDARRAPGAVRLRDAGQATAEYALVMLGAAVVALLVVTWATAGGGAGKVGRLFDKVLDAVIDRV